MTGSLSSRHATRIVPLVVACPLFMVNLDSSILLTAIPRMADSMGLNATDLTSLITAYLIALAVSMPLSGWASDRLGSKRLFIGAVALFTFGSLLCSLSTSLPMMIMARVVQGAGGGLMTPVARIVLLNSVPKKDLIGAMAWYTTPALLGPVIGPSLGGIIVEHFSWPLVFLVNLPFGVVTVIVALLLLVDVKLDKRPKFDGVGFFLLGGGLVVVLSAFDWLKGGITSAGIAAVGLVIGAALISAFYRHARLKPMPLINLSILKDAIYSPTLWGGSVFRLGTAALPFLLSISMQSDLGFSPTTVGLLLSSVAFGAMCAKPIAPRVIYRMGYRSLLILNSVASSLTMALLAMFSAVSPVWIVAIGLGVSGLLRSIQFTALNSLSYLTVPKDDIASASTLASIAQQVSIGFGVVLANILVTALSLSSSIPASSRHHGALILIALVCSGSVFWFLKLDRLAGKDAFR